MVWAEREVRYQTDYILETDRCLFWNVSVRNLRHKLDQYLVIGCLCSAPLRVKLRVPQEAQAAPPLTPGHPNEGGRTLCGPT